MYFHFFPFEHKIWRLYCNSYVGDLIILLSHAKKYGFKPYNCFTQIHIEIILLIGITALLGQMKAYKINSSIQKTYRSTAKIMISFKVAEKWRSIFSIDSIWQVSKTCFDFLILRIRNYRWVQNQYFCLFPHSNENLMSTAHSIEHIPNFQHISFSLM